MDNKNEVIQELNPDQMEKVSGGSEVSRKVCRYCGQEFNPIKYAIHISECKKENMEGTGRGDTTGGT